MCDRRGMTKKERIAELEQQIATLRTEQTKLLREQTRFEMDLWQGRIDDLELQMHLAGMGAHDKLQPLMDKLRLTWDDARSHLTDASSTASDMVVTMRQGLESAANDVRVALRETKNKLNS
jgi:chromosome segregation ATPase